jgi:mevalonate kinase
MGESALDWMSELKADFGRFSSIRLLLTNTLVPRDTKSLVAGVSAKRLAEPHIVDPIMEAIQEISDEARHLLGGGEVGRKTLVSRLEVSQFLGRRV